MAQLVERVLGKDEVTGSIPVSSSKTDRADFIARSFFIRFGDANRRFTVDSIAEGADIADAVWYFVAHAKNTTGAELIVDCGNMIQLYPVIPR